MEVECSVCRHIAGCDEGREAAIQAMRAQTMQPDRSRAILFAGAGVLGGFHREFGQVYRCSHYQRHPSYWTGAGPRCGPFPSCCGWRVGGYAKPRELKGGTDREILGLSDGTIVGETLAERWGSGERRNFR